jgi:hypothetical protein
MHHAHHAYDARVTLLQVIICYHLLVFNTCNQSYLITPPARAPCACVLLVCLTPPMLHAQWYC